MENPLAEPGAYLLHVCLEICPESWKANQDTRRVLT